MRPEVTAETVRAALEKRGVDVDAAQWESGGDGAGYVHATWPSHGVTLSVWRQDLLDRRCIAATAKVGDEYHHAASDTIDSALVWLAETLAEDAECAARGAAAMASAVALLTPKPKAEPA